MTEASPKRRELFIWWTTSADMAVIGPEAPTKLPEYVREQYRDRLGRAGRGRLWVHARFGAREITEWPKTSIAQTIHEGSSGGVVFSGADLKLFTDDVPGLVTDFNLRVIVVRP